MASLGTILVFFGSTLKLSLINKYLGNMVRIMPKEGKYQSTFVGSNPIPSNQNYKQWQWMKRRTWIVGKDRLWVTSFIYKYKTSTTYPLYETTWRFVLINKWCLWVQSALSTIRLIHNLPYPQSAFTHNQGTTTLLLQLQRFPSFNIRVRLSSAQCDQIKIAKCL